MAPPVGRWKSGVRRRCEATSVRGCTTTASEDDCWQIRTYDEFSLHVQKEKNRV